jgi:hypothetical protein
LDENFPTLPDKVTASQTQQSVYDFDDSSSDESMYGPDGYLDGSCEESICGWRRNPSYFNGKDQKNWKANSLIIYCNGRWNDEFAVSVKKGRKLLDEYFRKLKQKEIDKKKREIEESGASYYA